MASHDADLSALRRLAEDGRRLSLPGTGHYVLWGLVIIAGYTGTYAALQDWTTISPGIIWIAVVATGWAGSLILGYREGTDPRSVAFVNRLSTITWITAGAALTATFVGLLLTDPARGAILMPIAHGVLGVVFAVHGGLTGGRWLYAIAAAWIASVPALFVLLDRPEAMLFSAACILALSVIPGVILGLQARRS